MTNLQSLIAGPRAMQLGMWFSQHMPEGLGHRLMWWTSGVACQVKPAVYRIVQANLSQVLGPGVGGHDLEQAVRQVFHSALRSYYDLYRALQLPREKIVGSVEVPEAAKEVIRSVLNRGAGSVLVFPHLGNFDLGGQALSTFIKDIQLLTLPNPPPGFQLANELRRLAGVTVTPLSSAALRQAIKLLRRGGIVSLAVDRPVSDLDEPVPFFGRPARVPSGHVRLALKTNAAVVVACCYLSPETQRYTVHLEPPLEMIRTGNREEEVWVNMRQVLDALEAVIRRWSGQWQMFVPVWPELLEA
jgi:lauroyl/myristoyl acyltransferase